MPRSHVRPLCQAAPVFALPAEAAAPPSLGSRRDSGPARPHDRSLTKRLLCLSCPVVLLSSCVTEGFQKLPKNPPEVTTKEFAETMAAVAKTPWTQANSVHTLENGGVFFPAMLKAVKGDAGLLCKLLYGCGLRVAEGLALRVKDVDLNGGTVTVRGGKGDKDRMVTLPKVLLQPLAEHRARIELIHKQDRASGLAGVYLPNAMAVKHPAAAESWEWFWLFPSPSLSVDPRSGIQRRHHVNDINISRELARASKMAGLTKRVTAHVLRH